VVVVDDVVVVVLNVVVVLVDVVVEVVPVVVLAVVGVVDVLDVVLEVVVEVLPGVVVVVLVDVGHTSVTRPSPPAPPSVASAGFTQLSHTRFPGDPPSGHVPAFVIASENLLPTLYRQISVSTGRSFFAAFA
jgi:hypothetical protein